jgi:hypothetical protein
MAKEAVWSMPRHHEQRARELDGGCRSGLIRMQFGKVAIGSAGLSVLIYVRQAPASRLHLYTATAIQSNKRRLETPNYGKVRKPTDL